MNDALKELIKNSAANLDYQRSDEYKELQRTKQREEYNRKITAWHNAIRELEDRVPKLESFIEEMRQAYLMNMEKQFGEAGYAHQLAMVICAREALLAKAQLYEVKQHIHDLKLKIKRGI